MSPFLLRDFHSSTTNVAQFFYYLQFISESSLIPGGTLLSLFPFTVGLGPGKAVIFSQQFILLICFLSITIGYPTDLHKLYLHPNEITISKALVLEE